LFVALKMKSSKEARDEERERESSKSTFSLEKGKCP
jgi:hypothetical protein